MNKIQYINNEDVKSFIIWISSKLDKPNSLKVMRYYQNYLLDYKIALKQMMKN